MFALSNLCFLSLFGLLAAVAGPTQAQTPLSGSEVALYFSKKNLSYPPHYAKAFAAFVQQEDSLGLSDEALKLAYSIQAGNYLTQQLQALGSPRSWFAASRPEVAQALIRSYQPGQPISASSLRAQLAGADYLLAIDSLIYRQEKRRNLLVYSNQIIDQPRNVEVVRMQVRLVNLQSGAVYAYTATYDADKAPGVPVFINWQAETRPAARMLALLLDQALLHLFIQLSE